ncbi:unnamed protein product [Lota lota]
MSEPRTEEQEEEMGDRAVRDPERVIDNKGQVRQVDFVGEHQGPLSSIRAAIKRSRTNYPIDHSRERRRPEITILSAEPLANSSWFPEASGIFTSPPASHRPPPAPESSWPGSVQADPQPPPSYDQVIKEKTQEEHVSRPTAIPRRLACTSTSTSATQTDPVREETSASPPLSPAIKKPQKPPRPLLLKTCKEATIVKSEPTDRQTTNVSIATENQNESKSCIEQGNTEDYTHTCSRSVTVQWDSSAKNSVQHLKVPINSQSTPVDFSTPSSESVPAECPVPLPRLKKYHRKHLTEEVNVTVQTLVSLSDIVDNIQVTSSNNQEESSSNKYIEQLLEVFDVDNSSLENDKASESNSTEQSTEADGKMSAIHSQREISARIAAFETQLSTEEETAAQRPKPHPRNAFIKPPVSSKPSIASRPSFKYSGENNNVELPSTAMPQKPLVAPRPQKPLSAPRPQPAMQPGGCPSIGGLQEMMPNKVPVLSPSRLSIKAKVKSLEQQLQQENHVLAPPVPGAKPFKEPLIPNLNLNNHNSTFMATEDQYYDKSSNHAPFEPQHSLDSAFSGNQNKQSITRRPTTIRVNSMTSKSLSLDSPPSLPTQMPVGSMLRPVSHHEALSPGLPSPETFYKGQELTLPPRPSEGKVLPTRPPPAKAGPSRPPPPSHDASDGASLVQASQWGASSTAPVQKPNRRGPALPPRPSPGHRLYNKYTLELPHGIAVCNYNGANTGELSFQKNDVLVLLEEMDHRTVMCQVGEVKGLVQRCHMTVITPLAPQDDLPQIPNLASSFEGGGLQVEAIHDFQPAGPEELGLRAGDVVIMVEQVDNDWYKGTCRGYTGFFPINYVNVLSNSPQPSHEKKKPPVTVSGPRCVARFDFEGEQGDELIFSEGDVISLIEYMGHEWAKGQLGPYTGIFPLSFVEVVEDLPLPPMPQQPQTRIALPGRNHLANLFCLAMTSEFVVLGAPQPSGPEWVVALYDFNGQTGEDLSFKQGDRILVTKHLDTEWRTGRLNGREGIFPRAFVEGSSGQSLQNHQQRSEAGGSTAKALFQFTADCQEELSLQAGDIITNLESVDDEWFLGDLRGKRALVPKNYVQVLG